MNNTTATTMIPTGDVQPGTQFKYLGQWVTAAEWSKFHGLRRGTTVALTDGRTVELFGTRVEVSA